MRKAYKMENLECANCAAKMEQDIKELDGVNNCTISFMTSRMTLDTESDNQSDVLESAQKICSGYESDCRIFR